MNQQKQNTDPGQFRDPTTSNYDREKAETLFDVPPAPQPGADVWQLLRKLFYWLLHMLPGTFWGWASGWVLFVSFFFTIGGWFGKGISVLDVPPVTFFFIYGVDGLYLFISYLVWQHGRWYPRARWPFRAGLLLGIVIAAFHIISLL